MKEGSGRTSQEPIGDAAGKSRRQMLRAGLIAAPMIVSLRGRPALAQTASLGSLGIFYGRYTEFDGKWVPADPDGNPLFIPGTEYTTTDSEGNVIQKGKINYDRRTTMP